VRSQPSQCHATNSAIIAGMSGLWAGDYRHRRR
jgi:hypothetical protein